MKKFVDRFLKFKNFNSIEILKINIISKPKINFYFCTNETLISRNIVSNHSNISKIFSRFENGIVKRDEYITYLNYIKITSIEFKEEEVSCHQNTFLKYLYLSINKSILNQITFDEIFPLVIIGADALNINSEEFWKIINTQFFIFYHRIGINLIFKILKQFDVSYSGNSNVFLLKKNYFNNLTRDKILGFNLETLLSYLSVFNGFHKEQNLINDIQNLIINLTKENNEYEETKELTDQILNLVKNENNKLINYKIILSHLLVKSAIFKTQDFELVKRIKEEKEIQTKHIF